MPRSPGCVPHLVGYTIEHKNLPEKRRLFWQAAGKLVFDAQPSRASNFGELTASLKRCPDTKIEFFPGLLDPGRVETGRAAIAGSSGFGVDARSVTPQKEEASKKQMVNWSAGIDTGNGWDGVVREEVCGDHATRLPAATAGGIQPGRVEAA